MSRLVWDQTGQRKYSTGVDRGVVYARAEDGSYPSGEAWNGLLSTTLSPSGAEPSPLYANNNKYLNLISKEELSFTIGAYTYPDSFAECIGEKEIVKGVMAKQQNRKPFGFTCRNLIGNDTQGTAHGYEIHLIYGAQASVSESAFTTINESPEATEMTWECSTTPVAVNGCEPTSLITISSLTADPAKLKALEDILYGSADVEARLPMPDEIVTLMGTSVVNYSTPKSTPTSDTK